MKEGIKGDQITFLIRGLYSGYHPSYRESETFRLIRSIEEFFPESKIIFSTWLEYKHLDKIKIQHPKVEYVINKGIDNFDIKIAVGNQKDLKKYKNNINSQITSIRNGLDFTKSEYVCIVRSDFVFHNNKVIKLYQRFKKHKYNKKFSLFSQPILIPFYGSVNSHKNLFSNSPNFPFHPSDMFHFGLLKDLKDLYDCPWMTKNDLEYFLYNPRGKSRCLRLYDSGYLCRFLPEQYIFTNFLRKKFILTQTDFINMEDRPEKFKKLSHQLITNNYFMASFREIGASWQNPTKSRLLKLPFFLFKNRTIIVSSLNFHLSRYGFFARKISLPRKLFLSLTNLFLFLNEFIIGFIYNLDKITSVKDKLNLRLRNRKIHKK